MQDLVTDDDASYNKILVTYAGQRVRVGKLKSNASAVSSSVQRVSIIGPLLFIVFINDLPVKIKSENFSDTKTTPDMLTKNCVQAIEWLQNIGELCCKMTLN